MSQQEMITNVEQVITCYLNGLSTLEELDTEDLAENIVIHLFGKPGTGDRALFDTASADPSWYTLTLALLADEYPKFSDQVWGETISANARPRRLAREAGGE